MKQYRKIDIYVNGKYDCSTTWSKTCKEARARYLEKYKTALFMAKTRSVKAHFAEGR